MRIIRTLALAAALALLGVGVAAHAGNAAPAHTATCWPTKPGCQQ